MPRVSEEYLESRRRWIITTARDEFARRGFGPTSMSDLVGATGLSMGALYRYFPSKADLILAVVEGRDGPVDGRFDVTKTPAELLSRLAEYLNAAQSDDAVAHAKLVTHIWSSAAIDPDIAAVAIQRHAALRDHLVQQMTAAPTDVTASGRAEVALAALIGYAALVASGYPLEHEVFLESVLATVSA